MGVTCKSGHSSSCGTIASVLTPDWSVSLLCNPGTVSAATVRDVGDGEGETCEGVLGSGDCEGVDGECGRVEWLHILERGLASLPELELGATRGGTDSERREGERVGVTGTG